MVALAAPSLLSLEKLSEIKADRKSLSLQDLFPMFIIYFLHKLSQSKDLPSTRFANPVRSSFSPIRVQAGFSWADMSHMSTPPRQPWQSKL
jgi:hypothetical protein